MQNYTLNFYKTRQIFMKLDKTEGMQKSKKYSN